MHRKSPGVTIVLRLSNVRYGMVVDVVDLQLTCDDILGTFWKVEADDVVLRNEHRTCGVVELPHNQSSSVHLDTVFGLLQLNKY